jgi:AcrR family transcriptional regulator
MAEEKEIRERILSKAREMFTQFGYSKVTMEEVATELGMSKKTLYKFFPGKEHLIKSIISEVRCEVSDYCDNLIQNKDVDFVDKLKQLMNFFSKQADKFRGPLLHDLEKAVPECWAELNDMRIKHSYEKFNDLLAEGKKAGAFRHDIDQQLILLIFMNAMQSLLNPNVLSEVPYSGSQIFDTLIKVIFEGVLSEDGRNKYISQAEGVTEKDE